MTDTISCYLAQNKIADASIRPYTRSLARVPLHLVESRTLCILHLGRLTCSKLL